MSMSWISFIHDLTFDDLPEVVVSRAKLYLLDLIGVAASGRQTRLSEIAHGFAARQLGCGCASGSARLLFDDRAASAAGAAYAGASTIDSFDAHDGHALTKGHAGVALLPALFAVADSGTRVDGRNFLTSLVMGYEIATRAGMALHSSVPEYHTSGAWNALGCAAIAARLLGLGAEATRQALGTAEYHGPRSQMMRAIDHPTMVKDGSAWGALAGVSAAYLAADGFTGAPAVTVEAPERSAIWSDLGQRWRILEQYVKPYPVCRWAQPAVEAAAKLQREHDIRPESIARVRIETFGAAVRLGNRVPRTTEEAQYAAGFPVAALLVNGRIGAAEISAAGLQSPQIAALCQKIELQESAAFTARFPAERFAIVAIEQADGTVWTSGPTTARGDPDHPLPEGEIVGKFRQLTDSLSDTRRAEIERAIATLAQSDSQPLRDAVLAPLRGNATGRR